MKLSLTKIDELFYMLLLLSMQIKVTLVKPENPGSTDSVFIVYLHLGMHSEFTSVGDKGRSQHPLDACVTLVTLLNLAMPH